MREAGERVKLLRDLAAQTVDRQVQVHERRRGHPENGHEFAELKVPRHSLPICEQERFNVSQPNAVYTPKRVAREMTLVNVFR